MIQRMLTRRNMILAGLAAAALIIGVLMFAAAGDEVVDPAVVDLEADAQPGVLPSGGSEPLGDSARYVVSGEAANPSDPASGDQSDPSVDSDSPTPGNEGSTDTPSDALSESDLRILWWNDTSSKSPSEAMISIEDSVWNPDPDVDSARGLLADVLVGDTLTLVVLPDGESGVRIEVPILITSDMDPTSDADAIHVEVSDSSVRVLGNAVDNFDVTFDRF